MRPTSTRTTAIAIRTAFNNEENDVDQRSQWQHQSQQQHRPPEAITMSRCTQTRNEDTWRTINFILEMPRVFCTPPHTFISFIKSKSKSKSPKPHQQNQGKIPHFSFIHKQQQQQFFLLSTSKKTSPHHTTPHKSLQNPHNTCNYCTTIIEIIFVKVQQIAASITRSPHD